jgi:hypothetical protein
MSQKQIGVKMIIISSVKNGYVITISKDDGEKVVVIANNVNEVLETIRDNMTAEKITKKIGPVAIYKEVEKDE